MPDFVLLIVGALVPIAALVLALASGRSRGAETLAGADPQLDADDLRS